MKDALDESNVDYKLLDIDVQHPELCDSLGQKNSNWQKDAWEN